MTTFETHGVATMPPVIDAPIISADSHITEPPNTYTEHIDPAWRERAPKVIDHDRLGEVFVVEGMSRPLSLSTAAAAGKKPEDIKSSGAHFDDLHRGGWDPQVRMADQVRDGVAAEVIYPSIGMILCNLADLDYKRACMEAYNRWLAEFCGARPDRLLGLGQTAMRTPEEGIADLHAIRDLGLRGVMLPGAPGVEDYDSPVYDEFWEAAIGLGLPLSFHILTMRSDATRGPKMAGFLSIVRGCQDVMAMLVMGGVFERTRTSRWCAPRPTQDGCRTSCTAWTTPTSGTASGCRPGRSCPSCRASTSPRTSTSRSRTTGRRSGRSTT